MVKRKVKSILCALMVTSIFSGTVATTMNINTVIAEAKTTIPGLQTKTGVITGKVKLKNTFPTDESLLTVKHLKTISTSVNPTDNPEMFQVNITQPIFSVQKNFLTDVIYHHGRIYTYSSGRKEQIDDFYKILSLEKAERQEYVTVTYASATFTEGEFWGYGVDTATYQNKTAYDYLVSEDKKPVKPPIDNGGGTEKKVYSSTRLGGLNRFETAIAIAKEFSNTKVDNVIIANAWDFPDSLSASALSKKLNAPILLVDKNASNSNSVETLNYIKNNMNKNGTVYLLGGTGVVSDNIITNLKSSGFNNFKRLGGIDRYETNRLINKQLGVAKGTPVIIAYGYEFADALSISNISGIKNMPIYLAKNDSIDSKVLSDIKNIAPSQIYIVGGNGVVTDKVANTLKGITPNITRLGGLNRYETSLAIAKHFNLNTKNAVITLGTDFPDALSGSALAIKNNAPIILINNDIAKQKAYIDNTNIEKLYILGSNGVISDSLVDRLKK